MGSWDAVIQCQIICSSHSLSWGVEVFPLVCLLENMAHGQIGFLLFWSSVWGSLKYVLYMWYINICKAFLPLTTNPKVHTDASTKMLTCSPGEVIWFSSVYQGYTVMAILIKSKSGLNVGTVEFEFIFLSNWGTWSWIIMVKTMTKINN